MKSLKPQRKLRKKLTKKKEPIIELLELAFMSIPRKPRTKTIIRKIVKKDLKFNSSMDWTWLATIEREDKKEDAKGNDQMGDKWYSIPLSEYEISGSIPDDLDALAWDINTIIFYFWDNIPN
ncbi:hypothetical protein H5410_049818 [Solanum commersonii]|uniref:Uncharacterized protein n=1 Tax=Solanum commersonii TaxID=4109 RepID=A0A9J5WV44_SOLCO|nr:hypothetical protein H5410_049818 [Solanum commersonii]